MKIKSSRQIYEYEFGEELDEELRKRGFSYTVKWDSFSPNGLCWQHKDMDFAPEGIPEYLVKNEICKILKIEKTNLISFKYNMSVDYDDYDETYSQVFRSIIIKTKKEI